MHRYRTTYCEICRTTFSGVNHPEFEKIHADEFHGGALDKEHLEILKELDTLYPAALLLGESLSLKPVSIFTKIYK